MQKMLVLSILASASELIASTVQKRCLRARDRARHLCFSQPRTTLYAIPPNQKFTVVASSRIIGIHRSSVDLRRRPSSAFQSFPIISNAGSAAFPMLALVGNARDSVF